MAAVPKNKITRAERGKRRRGNRQMLKKDAHSAIPLHKRGFMAELFKFIGVSGTPVTDAQKKSEDTSKKAEKKASSVPGVIAQPKVRALKPPKIAAGKVKRQTQHKG